MNSGSFGKTRLKRRTLAMDWSCQKKTNESDRVIAIFIDLFLSYHTRDHSTGRKPLWVCEKIWSIFEIFSRQATDADGTWPLSSAGIDHQPAQHPHSAPHETDVRHNGVQCDHLGDPPLRWVTRSKKRRAFYWLDPFRKWRISNDSIYRNVHRLGFCFDWALLDSVWFRKSSSSVNGFHRFTRKKNQRKDDEGDTSVSFSFPRPFTCEARHDGSVPSSGRRL